jgi:antitoxin ParD1/3/4
MNISLDERFAPLVDALLKSGRYASADDIVRQSMLLLEAEEAKLQSLRDMINASIEAGGENTIEDVDRALAELDEELKREGY